MNFPKQIDTLRMGYSILCLRDHRSKFLNYDVVMSFILGNSADPDEMPPYVGFHLRHHCLPKYLLTGI